MKKKLKVEVIYIYEIEIDDESPIVKEYKDDRELVADLACYRFAALPVINNGVEIQDIEVQEWSITN